jgi:hypothetical protein
LDAALFLGGERLFSVDDVKMGVTPLVHGAKRQKEAVPVF